jgi:vacuolar-type H+-ATPase subunit H
MKDKDKTKDQRDMLPTLKKIIAADHNAENLVVQAQQEAEALMSQAQAEAKKIHEDLQIELAQVQKAVQKEFLEQAEARSGEVAAATDRYLDEMRKDKETHGEETAAFLVSRVLS